MAQQSKPLLYHAFASEGSPIMVAALGRMISSAIMFSTNPEGRSWNKTVLSQIKYLAKNY
jgi:hypothetical protein